MGHGVLAGQVATGERATRTRPEVISRLTLLLLLVRLEQTPFQTAWCWFPPLPSLPNTGATRSGSLPAEVRPDWVA
jgi:hypothetical protein